MEKFLRLKFGHVFILHIAGTIVYWSLFLATGKAENSQADILIYNFSVALSLLFTFGWQYVAVLIFMRRTHAGTLLHKVNMYFTLFFLFLFLIYRLSLMIDPDLDTVHAGQFAFTPVKSWTYLSYLILIINSCAIYFINIKLVSDRIKSYQSIKVKKILTAAYYLPMIRTLIGIMVFLGVYYLWIYFERMFASFAGS